MQEERTQQQIPRWRVKMKNGTGENGTLGTHWKWEIGYSTRQRENSVSGPLH